MMILDSGLLFLGHPVYIYTRSDIKGGSIPSQLISLCGFQPVEIEAPLPKDDAQIEFKAREI